MKILIIGKGGREHALAWKSAQSPLVKQVFIAPGNLGMKDCGTLVDIADSNVSGLADFAQAERIGLTIVGPENSLALGLVDEFLKRGLKIFGPRQAAARLESSKDFAKGLMKKYGIPTASYQSFEHLNEAEAYVRSKGAPIVIKEDGLKAGKGVTVALSLDEALTALKEAFDGGCPKVVIEECLEGFEFSLIALACGDKLIPLEIAQDHKRAFDKDLGPNTGGMGAYSPVEKITPEIISETMKKVMQPMAEALVKEGIPFTGFLYGGLMLTTGGVKTIEFNARFGDPEAEAILPRLKSDLIAAILDLLEGGAPILEWDPRPSLTVVLAAKGYPQKPHLGGVISLPVDLPCHVFHMGTAQKDGAWVSHGGRVLALTALGKNLEEARSKTYEAAGLIQSEALFYRKDIGAKA